MCSVVQDGSQVLLGVTRHRAMARRFERLRGCIQKFPDRVDNEVYAYNNKHSLEATQRVMAAKLTRLTHKIALKLHSVAENCTICKT